MEQHRVCLVVEDDDDIRGLISMVLSPADFEIRAVDTRADG
ncbi:hypothetical protein [Arthrobacter sp. ISL-85]|nr:hypothetical protein [Arthrobacter sp. ISL-85]